MAEKIYLGKSGAKEIETQYGPMMKLDLHVETLIEFAKKHATDRGYLKLDVCRRREESQHGDTHYICLNTFTTRSGQAPRPARQQAPAPQSQDVPPADQEVPF